VTVSDTTGSEIISYDFQITFDPSVVQPASTAYDVTGTMSSSMAITANSPASGHLVVSAFQSSSLVGAGTLINLKFTVVGTSGQTTPLTFEDYTDPSNIFHPAFQFNEGVPDDATTNGSVSVFGVAITGTVFYGNAIGAPTPRYVSNVTVASTLGSPSVSTTTAAPGPNAGQYTLSVGLGSSYTIAPNKTGGANNITSFDAARIAQHVAGVSLLTGNQLLVADVSNNGGVSSFDAGQIANYVVAGSNPGITGTWKFVPVSRSYVSITSNISGQDYDALLMGEVSGNWTNTGARPAAPELTAQSISVNASKITTSEDREVLVPVYVQGIENKGIIAYEFELRYDPSVVQPTSDVIDIASSVSRGLTTVSKTDEAGLLRVVVYGPMAIENSGLLLNLRFTAIGGPGSVSPLMWERIMFNEGDSATAITDGQIEIVE